VPDGSLRGDCDGVFRKMARPTLIVITLAGLLASAFTAAADGNLEARYTVTYTGIPLGQGAFVVEISDEGYSAAGSAMMAGLLKIVNPAKGTAAAQGQFVNGKVVPLNYSVSSETKERSEEIRLAGASGVIRDLLIRPARNEDDKDRVPITDEHRVGAVDPMSAALMPVPGTGDLAGPDACNRTIQIYDGRSRYDLIMNFERTDTMKDVKGFSGPAAMCRIAYRPVAGHRAHRKQVRELSENREIFAWLAPVAGTRVLVPVRFSIGTKIGTFIVQATHFSSTPKTRAAVNPFTR
jgi:hypothetical protein